jgi:hypothetical protein
MTTPQDIQPFPGHTTVDGEGSKAGCVYVDAEAGLPLWIAVVSGMFASRRPSRRSMNPGPAVTGSPGAKTTRRGLARPGLFAAPVGGERHTGAAGARGVAGNEQLPLPGPPET